MSNTEVFKIEQMKYILKENVHDLVLYDTNTL